MTDKEKPSPENLPISQELMGFAKIIIPVASIQHTDLSSFLHNNTLSVDDTKCFINSFNLFQVGEISITSGEKDIPLCIQRRQQALLTAAHHAGLTVATIIRGSGNGSVSIFMAVKGGDVEKERFGKQIKGIFPGKGISSIEGQLSESITNMQHGGILAGVPVRMLDAERQVFDFSPVIRSMSGQPFVIMVVSRPVANDKVYNRIKELMGDKDKAHKVARQTETRSEGQTKNWSAGVSAGINAVFFQAGGNASYGQGQQQNWSLSAEQQNSLAIYLEDILEQKLTSLKEGLSVGVWENFISYATEDESSSSVLAGAVIAELAQINPLALPVQNISAPLQKTALYIPRLSGMQRQHEQKVDSLSVGALSSWLSSAEAALVMSLPSASVPGFDIRIKPALSLTDTVKTDNKGSIGLVAEHGRAVGDSAFSISVDDIRKHIFVTGLTGSGKTTTVKQILAVAENTPFLVLESAKREYRRLHEEKQFDGLQIYSIGDAVLAPLRINPFMVLPGVSVITHIDNLKSIFNASFSLYGPMPYILEQCIFNVYRKKGWNITSGKHYTVSLEKFDACRRHPHIFPTMDDLKKEVDRYVAERGYKGELLDNIRSAIGTRLESLAVGAKGFIFNTNEFPDFEKLLNSKVVFELESLADDDDKAFFVGLILSFVSEYRQSLARDSALYQEDKLKHIMVVEEAHRLLKNISTERSSEMMGNPKGKAVESFCNIIAEMRSLGQGVIVAEQIPTKIAPDVIKNTNTKIAHRLVSRDDQSAMGASMGLDDEEDRYFNQLCAGFALIHKEGMAKPVELQVHNVLANKPVGDIAFQEKGKKQFFSMYGVQLDLARDLHDSGLLHNDVTKNVAFSVLNTVFLCEKELSIVLPSAIHLIRSRSGGCKYVADNTVKEAIKFWFFKSLFSEVIGICNEKDVNDDTIKSYERFWSDDDRKSIVLNRFREKAESWFGVCIAKKLKNYMAACLKTRNKDIDVNKYIEDFFIGECKWACQEIFEIYYHGEV